jgi:hypothetical protein
MARSLGLDWRPLGHAATPRRSLGWRRLGLARPPSRLGPRLLALKVIIIYQEARDLKFLASLFYAQSEKLHGLRRTFAGFANGALNLLPGFTSALLDSPDQFVFFAGNKLKIIVREFGPFLFHFALRDIPIAFNLKFIHKFSLLLGLLIPAIDCIGRLVPGVGGRVLCAVPCIGCGILGILPGIRGALFGILRGRIGVRRRILIGAVGLTTASGR